jgi:hypothetical protein
MLYWLHGYVTVHEIQEAEYVMAPGLAGSAGIKGALSLAMDDGCKNIG